ncbi:MAG TPA: hypothetical protein IAB66_00345 [Candidatus Caccousia avistercoris]|nr:hypothetical protein [Candidatus Caccousia avistercoris]
MIRLARERYLLHAGEEEINREGAEITLKTPKDKWDNFWFYHKKHVIIGTLAAILVGYMIYDLATKVEPDYNVAILSSQTIAYDAAEYLADALAPYGEDLNGDGQVVVQVNTFDIAQGAAAENVDPNVQMASMTKFMGDLQTGDSYIYFTDDTSFAAYVTEEGMFAYLDGSSVPEGATDYENMRLPVSECKALEGTEIGQYLQDFSISLRDIRQSLVEERPEYYLGAKALYENMVSGTVVTPEAAVETSSAG